MCVFERERELLFGFNFIFNYIFNLAGLKKFSGSPTNYIPIKK